MRKILVLISCTALEVCAAHKRNPFCYQQLQEQVVAEGYIQGHDVKIVLAYQKDGTQIIKKMAK